MGRIRLLAIAPEDGWAYFREGWKIFLIRPPFSKGEPEEISDGENVVESAVCKYGFWAEEKEFDNLEALVEFLEARMIKARNSPEFLFILEQARKFLEGQE